jgi:hypothetical protein
VNKFQGDALWVIFIGLLYSLLLMVDEKADHEGFNSFPGSLHPPTHHLRSEWFRGCVKQLSVSVVHFTIKQTHKLGLVSVHFIFSFKLMSSKGKQYTADWLTNL